MRWLLLLIAGVILAGCSSDAANTQAAVQSQKEINEQKNPDWQD